MNVIARYKKNLQVEITAGVHQFLADEPMGVGDDAGPNPYELLLSALGSAGFYIGVGIMPHFGQELFFSNNPVLVTVQIDDNIHFAAGKLHREVFYARV